MEMDKDLIDKLLGDYQKPEDLIGENGLLKQRTRALVEREDDTGIHRKSKVGRGCEVLRSQRPLSLKPSSAGSASGGLSRNPRLSVAIQPTGFCRWSFGKG